MKRTTGILLLGALLLGLLTACAGAPTEPTPLPVTVEGSLFGGNSDDKIAAEVSFDPTWLTEKDNRTYHPELARFCALLSADSYFREKDLEKGRQNRVLFADADPADYGFTAFLDRIGFEKTEHFESYLVTDDPTDSDDSVTLNVGYQTVGGYDVYAVVVRGCFSRQEWCSAFDIGATDAAGEADGSHPNWIDPSHHKGTDVAATRALAFLRSFMAENGDDARPDCLLITGHSRGGGIANLLGAAFEKDDGVRSYTYTFNAPPVTCAAGAENCETVFNLFDSGDFFTDPFPFAEGAFSRYGTDLSLAVSDSGEIRSAIAAMKGRDDYACVPQETADEYRTLFAARFPDRESLGALTTDRRTYETEEEAVSRRDTCLTLIGAENGLDLAKLVSVGEIEKTEEGTYALTVSYSGAALMRAYAMLLAYGEAAYGAVTDLFSADPVGCEIAGLLLDAAPAVTAGHLLLNSYVLASYVGE